MRGLAVLDDVVEYKHVAFVPGSVGGAVGSAVGGSAA